MLRGTRRRNQRFEYEGEGHGFRKAGNVVNSLETELVFYGEVFGFTPAGDLPEIDLVGR
jgi:hypothetical protein